MNAALLNKTAVVTGGGTGIGLAIATRFAQEGAHVFITGRRQDVLDDAQAAIHKAVSGDHAGHDGGLVEAVRADVSKLGDLDALYKIVRERRGSLDVVVANAGSGVAARLQDIDEQQVDTTFDTNVKGVVFTVQKALPLLNANASIVLIGSANSSRVAPGVSIYAATKAAVRNLARGWTADLAGTGIRVNVLSPGPTRTPGLAGFVPDVDALGAAVPLGRIGDPAEIAAAALFLASSASSFVNGVELFADGGQAQI